MAARAAKKPVKKALQPVVVTPSLSPLPSVKVLTIRTFKLLGKNWALFSGIGLWYAVVGTLLGALSVSGYDVASLRDQLGGKVIGSLGTYVALVGSGGGNTDQASGTYSTVLFIIASLAIIWALRHAHEHKKVRIRDAYYRGMYPLIPFVLILLVALLCLIPVTIGVSLYQFVIVNGIASQGFEIALWALVALAGLLASLYLLMIPILALYVVALPNMAPVVALKSAKRLALGRRWLLMRKMLFLPVVLLVTLGLIMLPFILFIPVAAQAILVVLGVVAITIAHAYFYELYRSTME